MNQLNRILNPPAIKKWQIWRIKTDIDYLIIETNDASYVRAIPFTTNLSLGSDTDPIIQLGKRLPRILIMVGERPINKKDLKFYMGMVPHKYTPIITKLLKNRQLNYTEGEIKKLLKLKILI